MSTLFLSIECCNLIQLSWRTVNIWYCISLPPSLSLSLCPLSPPVSRSLLSRSFPLSSSLFFCLTISLQHDTTVSSVGFQDTDLLDLHKLQNWLGTLMRERGIGIFLQFKYIYYYLKQKIFSARKESLTLRTFQNELCSKLFVSILLFHSCLCCNFDTLMTCCSLRVMEENGDQVNKGLTDSFSLVAILIEMNSPLHMKNVK